MKKTRQILSVFLSFCMIISCMVGMSVTASAEYLDPYNVYYDKKSSIKQGDTIYAMLSASMPDDEFKYVQGAVITIKPAGGGADIKTRAQNWTADADYNITAWEKTEYNRSNLGPYSDKYGSYYDVNIIEYIFTVESATPATVAVTGVSLDKTTATLTAGGDPIALTATVTPADATDKKVKWSVIGATVKLYSDAKCTTEIGADATDVLTVYAKGISGGYEADVNVTSNADNTKSATCAVTVNAAKPDVTISPEGAGIVTPVYDSVGMFWELTATPATGYSFVKWTFKYYGNPKESTYETLLTDEAFSDITAVFEEAKYSITMPNGGTAYVNQQEVTEAEEGATVTVEAPQAEPGTEFNGWTSTSEGVTFEDASKATTKFTMPANDVTISASFQNIAYNITMLNGGTAYVDGEPATTAEAGTVVTIKAKSSVSTPAKFNGWTTTTEGVEFADADSVETTFVMPISDVTITASFEGVTPYVPSYSTGTSTTTSSGTASSVDSASSKAKMWAVQNDDKSSITVGWEKVNGATKYSLYVRKNGKLEKVVDTKKTKVRINNPENNTTLEYVLKYTIAGVESAENSAYTASIKVYYKPAVKASSKDGAVILKWNKVEGAEKYRVYKYTGGKLVKVADTNANAVRLKNVTTGKTYKYAVKAYVDGKWTKVTKSDIVSVKVK